VTTDTPAGAAPTPTAATGAKGEVQILELTRAQRTIARRVAESKATIPDFQVALDADVTELLALRATLAEAGRAPSLSAFVVRAAGLALREHPRVNGAYQDGALALHGRVNVGVAVTGPDTLAHPTVFDADAKPATAIAEELRTLATKVREGTIASPDLAGATFTVADAGPHGATAFTAVIQPGQAAVLAAGAATERLALRDGATVARQVMTLTLSADHRILYAADAAAFLARVRDLLEDPAALAA
jgi:pyruvate dehydrogenase E2 component (dihydrolipoamide acetyltransferase)